MQLKTNCLLLREILCLQDSNQKKTVSIQPPNPLEDEIFSNILFTCSTLSSIFAEVSKNRNPFSFANPSPSSYKTWRLYHHHITFSLPTHNWYLSSLSIFVPTTIIGVWGSTYSLASPSHLGKLINVSLLIILNNPTLPHSVLLLCDRIDQEKPCYTSVLNWGKACKSLSSILNSS